MALVQYSDSESSDTEKAAEQPKTSKPNVEHSAASSRPKSGIKKVGDKSNPHRVRLELPKLSNETPTAEPEDEEGRPAKKAKTAGAFGGFNSFLPAPKNANKQLGEGAPSSGLLKGRPTGLRQGVSLKTGAAPAFSRETPPELEEERTWDEEESNAEPASIRPVGNGDPYDSGGADPQPEVNEETKPVTKPMMFKPLSVGRKNPKKKKAPPSQEARVPDTQTQAANELANMPTKKADPAPKPKRSLFSSIEQETPEVPSTSNGQYEPLLDDVEEQSGSYGADDHVQLLPGSDAAVPLQKAEQPSDLGALADSLGLSPAQRRQLFGRNATGKGATVAHFSVSAEYSNNNDMITNEANAAPVHNPVRAIAPGKHSLQQLLNAATSQKDALEEHFATGKRNKADAGSRYGW